MRQFFSKHNRQKGQSLTEMAVSMVILLILIAGIFDVGRAIFTYMSMRDAAQEGASYAAVVFLQEEGDHRDAATFWSDSCKAIGDRVKENLNYPTTSSIQTLLNGIDCYSATLTRDACAGHEARVTVELSLPISTPFIGAFIGSQNINLRATATDTILRPYCK